MKKRDLKNRKDIEKVVFAFYEKVKTDTEIGYYFDEVVKINWETHLPKMCDFWENILFYTGNYEGNPMQAHQKLSQKTTMKASHFTHWNKLFDKTIDGFFMGTKADEMKQRAQNIAQAMIDKTVENKNAKP